MTTSHPRAFKSLNQLADPKLVEKALQDQAITSDIPTNVKPSEAAEKITGSVTLPAKAKTKRVEPAPTRRLSVEVPVYVIKELNKRASDEECTKTFLILSALRKLDIDVKDIDITEDGRRGN